MVHKSGYNLQILSSLFTRRKRHIEENNENNNRDGKSHNFKKKESMTYSSLK